MEFKLSFTPEVPDKLINYKQPFLLTGSCFTQHMAEKLAYHHFNTISQPNGVVFNPISIAKQLQKIGEKSLYTADNLFLHNELWHTWDHHSSFSSIEPNEALENINNKLQLAHHQLKNENPVLIITLGSAWVYRLKSSENAIVANCHKYPQANFNKELLTVNTVVEAIGSFIQTQQQTQIIFTVSPVRHTKDGLVGNNISKSVLIQAVYELCSSFKHCYYFPAYEIVIDELRDYRFYANDLIHPNDLAIEYVWDRFVQTCFDNESKLFIEEVKQYKQMQQHRFLHQGLTENQRFKLLVQRKKEELAAKYPLVNF